MPRKPKAVVVDEKARIAAWYRSTHWTSHPDIQPHELEAVEADFEVAASIGLEGADAAAHVRERLMERRRLSWMEQRAVTYLQRTRGRQGGQNGRLFDTPEKKAAAVEIVQRYYDPPRVKKTPACRRAVADVQVEMGIETDERTLVRLWNAAHEGQ